MGIVTSGAYGHQNNKALGLAHFTEEAVMDECGFEVEILGKKFTGKALNR